VSITNTYAFDSVSINILQGIPIWNGTWRPDDYSHSLKQISIKGHNHIDKSKYRWGLGAEFGLHTAKGIETQKANTYGISLHIERDVKRLFNVLKLYVGGEGGFALLSPRHGYPNLGSSGVLGTFAGYVGFNVLMNDKWSMGCEYKLLQHFSNLFNDDKGVNYQNISIIMSYRFK
jgi:hypothetical protein